MKRPVTKNRPARRQRSRVLTNRERVVAAAVFARSNMGQGLPAKDQIRDYWEEGRRVPDIGSVISNICSQIMETDEHYDMYMEEARGWYTTLIGDTVAKIKNVHPDIARLLDLSEESPHA